MSKGVSAYLNLLRLVAALAVFYYHLADPVFSGGSVWAPSDMGHAAVILFFVLSGYVIAYVALERERTLDVFLVSRAARVYSVALPALMITFAIQLILWHLGEKVPVYQLTQPLKYLALFLTFTGDSWFLNEHAFGNGPYWSLDYEVWYYAAFAAAFYTRGWMRAAALIAVALVTGPRIWLLAPLWCSGCLVYSLHRRPGPGSRAARLLFVASLIAAGLALFSGTNSAISAWTNHLSGGWMKAHLNNSQWVVGDLLTASVVCLNVYVARYANLQFGRSAATIAWAASFTFSLYLLHYPLLQLYRALNLPVPLLIAAVLGSVIVVGHVTERQKDRLRAWLTAGLMLTAFDRLYAGQDRAR